MTLLIIYISVALLFSFLCSVAEAVLLSVSTAHIKVMEQQGQKSGYLLAKLKNDINKPLSAILTLNTIAHTVGAVGAGAQATTVFGNQWMGLFSGLLTFAILVFSEIIPKTLGATYWRALSGVTAHGLVWLVKILYPFVILSEQITRFIGKSEEPEGFNRDEFAAMADLGMAEGQLEEQESRILKNLFLLRETDITSAMTPRTVVFSLPENLTVEAYFSAHYDSRFSRIPIYRDDREQITGFVLKDDLLLAKVRNNVDSQLSNYRRDLPAMLDTTSLAAAFELLLEKRAHIMMIIDEYGGMEGIITLEDVLETLLGLEIVDESDRNRDMQRHAKRLWQKRIQEMGLDISEEEGRQN